MAPRYIFSRVSLLLHSDLLMAVMKTLGYVLHDEKISSVLLQDDVDRLLAALILILEHGEDKGCLNLTCWLFSVQSFTPQGTSFESADPVRHSLPAPCH